MAQNQGDSDDVLTSLAMGTAVESQVDLRLLKADLGTASGLGGLDRVGVGCGLGGLGG
jgi:hypothetical protein